MRQPQYPIHHGLERPEILLEEDVHVTADNGGRQLCGTGLAERLRVLVEADKQAVLPHDGLEERIVRRHLRLEERPVRKALVSPSASTAADTRDSSSDAALRVNVRPRMRSAGTPCAMRLMMRRVIV